MRRISKVLSLLMALVLIMTASGTIGTKADSTLLIPSKNEDPLIIVTPGQITHVSLPVRSSGATIQLYSIKAECLTRDGMPNSLMQVSNLKLVYTETGQEVELSSGYNFYSSANVSLDFNIVADESLKIGYNTIRIFGQGINFETTEDFSREQLDLMNLETYTNVERIPAYISVTSISYDQDSLVPGNSVDIQLTVKNEGEMNVLNAYMTLDFGNSGIVPDYSVAKIKIGDLPARESKTITVKVKVLSTATPGLTEINASFTGKNKAGEEVGPFMQSLYVTIKEATKDNNVKTPLLTVSTKDNYGELKRGEKMTIPVIIKNDGKAPAKSITLAISQGVGAGEGITKDYTSDVLEVGDLGAGKSTTVKVPITVSEDVAAGLHEFAFEINYKDADGNAMTAAKMSMYLEAKPKPEEDKKPDLYNYLDIHNVSQSPSNPTAGSKISVSFEITNNGNGAVKNLRVYGTGLSSSGFEPVSNEPYQTVGDLAAGASKKVSMVFNVGENIASGMNTLTIGYEFIDENGDKKSDSASVYILNITGKDPEGTKDVGRPKLIISDYATDEDILKAGETFNFTFSIKNTHQTKDAKNIKVTVSQVEGIFSPAAGTNIFYIDSIEPGQVEVQTMNLKTRADATTGDYEVTILLEYEYDDMSDADREKGGVSESNIIKLRATENYRPVIENISLDAYEGLYVGVPVDMNFEFYNMGKSTLGNVYVTVEGDFALANNSKMSYVGAIQGYGQEFINPQVVALVEGEATGILTVHFEDSNGDEVTLSQEFTQFVMSQGGGYDEGDWNYPIDEGGYEDWVDPNLNPDGEGEGEGEGFFSKIKPWMWIVGASVIVIAVAVPFIIKGVKKSKSKVKVDEDEDY